jgi:DNA-binding HxlR family transcriptional regulator
MALLDLLGRRWALRVLWELRGGESLTFRQLQARCAEVSSSVLNDRLRELRAAGIVTAQPGQGYSLTREGGQLLNDLEPLDGWSKRWARRTTRAEAKHASRPHRLCRGVGRDPGAPRATLDQEQLREQRTQQAVDEANVKYANRPDSRPL